MERTKRKKWNNERKTRNDIEISSHALDERDAIRQWLKEHDTSPCTGKVLSSKIIRPNYTVRAQIMEYRQVRR